MSFASLPNKALVVGGFTESPEADEALVNAITDPHSGIVRDARHMRSSFMKIPTPANLMVSC